MFNFIDVEQNTEEWEKLRAGKLTSSKLGCVMANFGKAFGDPAKKYAVQIAVEQITGEPTKSSYMNQHMERGHEQEPAAKALYEQEMFCNVSNGGFWDGGFIGCSPDGLVGKDGVIEIKSVIDSVHYANIKRNNVDPAYNWQCIGNLKFTGREWIDFVSFCEDFPEGKKLYTYRLFAKDLTLEFARIDERITEFKELVNEVKQEILTSKYIN